MDAIGLFKLPERAQNLIRLAEVFVRVRLTAFEVSKTLFDRLRTLVLVRCVLELNVQRLRRHVKVVGQGRTKPTFQVRAV